MVLLEFDGLLDRQMRMTQIILMASFAVAALAGCSPRRAVELLLVGDHFDLTPHVAYGADPRQRLDVYRPRGGARLAPVVLFLYGGRWQTGSKEQYRLLGDALTREGVVAVIPDYRLYPAAHFPAWMEDGARAVRWARDNIARYGGDPGRIFVVGHSAGAHTALLLALDKRYLGAAGVAPGVVRGFVGLAGPVATTWTDPDVQALMGPPAGWPATYPLTHATGAVPPLLLLHGRRDRTVAPDNALRLAARVRERGGCVRTVLYRGLDHVGIVIALSVPKLGIAPVVEDLMAFVRDPRVACRGGGGR